MELQTGLDVDIKWPNDLLVGGLKVCGILAELQAEVDMVKTLIVGVGINVNNRQMPDDIAHRATSLRIASEHDQSRLEIFAEFLEQFEGLYQEFERTGPSVIIERWTKYSSFASGRKLEIHDGVRVLSGITRGLNPLGALRLERDGKIEDVYSGDVIHRGSKPRLRRFVPSPGPTGLASVRPPLSPVGAVGREGTREEMVLRPQGEGARRADEGTKRRSRGFCWRRFRVCDMVGDIMSTSHDPRYPTGKFQAPESVSDSDRERCIAIIAAAPAGMRHAVSGLSAEQLRYALSRRRLDCPASCASCGRKVI